MLDAASNAEGRRRRCKRGAAILLYLHLEALRSKALRCHARLKPSRPMSQRKKSQMGS